MFNLAGKQFMQGLGIERLICVIICADHLAAFFIHLDG
ncbi:hypothetical protein CHCC20375_3940 [Bacillus licheniformis]|nr:hypothetical protein CHCC20375_3940 [Bacillus licheniformis]